MILGKINICHCGAQLGYKHHPACPEPLYHDNPAQAEKWIKQYRANLARLQERTLTQIEKLQDTRQYADEVESAKITKEIERLFGLLDNAT